MKLYVDIPKQSVEKRAVLSWREVGYRFSSPRWLFSHSWNSVCATAADFVPTNFNVVFRRVKPFTMVSYARLRGLYDAVERISADHIPGDVVECGVAHGGSAALLGLSLKRLGEKRQMWLYDTFCGIPSPTQQDPDYEIADLYTGQFGSAKDEIRATLLRLGIDEGVELVPGLFQDTAPRCNIDRISLLHLDGDWYDSLKVCLENFYDRVSPGGIIQFDDYGYWAGARKAVDEFLAKRGIKSKLKRIDYSGRQLVKM